MSLDAELRLVAKIIATGDLRSVLRSNISQVMFSNTEAKEIFKFIKDHYHNPAHYGRVPTRRVVYDHRPTKLPENITETLSELCEEVRKKTMSRELREACEEATDLIDTQSPFDALAHLRAKINTIQTMVTTSRDLILADGAEDLIQEYENQETSGAMSGIPWPWDRLNEETGGIQQQDYIIVFGRPKSMKSWFVTKILTHAYAFASRRVLVYSCEMPPAQFRKRVACCIAEVDYERLKKGQLTPEEKVIYFSTLRNLKEEEARALINGHSPSVMFTSDKDDMLGGGVSHILSKAEAFKPDLIIVDSFYRMKNDRSGKRSMKWQDQYAIIQDLKHLTQQLDVPVIGVTQRTRKKGDDEDGGDDEEHLEDIAYADAAGQEADMIIRIKKGVTFANGTVNLDAMIAGAREIRPGGMVLNVSPCTSWSFSCWLSDVGKKMSEVEQARHAQSEDQTKRSLDGDNTRQADVKKKAKKKGGGRRKAKVDDDEKHPVKAPGSYTYDQDTVDADMVNFGDNPNDDW